MFNQIYSKERGLILTRARRSTLVSIVVAGMILLNLALPVAAQRQITSVSRLKEQTSSLDSLGSPPPSQPTGSTGAPLPQSDCYPDAPPKLIEAVRTAAVETVRSGDPRNVTTQNIQIVFFTIAHAVSVDAVNVDQERRTLINRIGIKRLQEQTRRTDKQLGASARAEGSTSAAEKPGFAEILGLAIERGAIQKEVNGTTLTLSTSPYAFVAAAQGDTATTYKNYGYLAAIGISANFNISNQDNVLLNATRKQLAEWNVRVRLTPDRTMRSQEAEDIWNGLSGQFAEPVLVLSESVASQFRSVELEAKRREIQDRLLLPTFTDSVKRVLDDTARTTGQKTDEIARLILCQVKTDIFDQVRSGAFRIDQATRDRIINETIPKYAAALKAKEEAIDEFERQLIELSFKPLLTFAYTNKREAMGSDYSVLKLLFEKKNAERLKIVANAGFSIYHNPDRQMNQQQIRDYAAALSFEGTAGRSPFLNEELDESQITFALTGRYQRLLENRGVPDKKADIAVAQFKLEIPLFTGATIPISVTYANATELIKEDHVRANFGFTIDTDKILQVLSLKKLKAAMK